MTRSGFDTIADSGTRDDDLDGAGECDEASDCDDGLACTLELCNSSGACEHTPNNALCTGGSECAVATCDPGAGCVYEADPTLCAAAGCMVPTCDVLLGCDVMPDHAACDDGDPANTEVCNEDTESCQTVVERGTWTWIDGPSAQSSSDSSCTVGAGMYPQPPASSPPTGPLRPGARAHFGFLQTSSGPVLYGGLGCGSADWIGTNLDRWRRNTTTNTWEWLGGHDLPSTGLAGWPNRMNHTLELGIDSKIYMFAGWTFNGTTTVLTNSMYVHDGDTASWQRLSGDDDPTSAPAAYVDERAYSANNLPGARAGYLGWTAPDGTLWYYGGADAAGSLRDMWSFNPSLGTSGQWGWMSGDSTVDTGPTASSSGLDAFPGGLTSAMGWTGTDGNLYLFGGGSAARGEIYSAVWRFCLMTTGSCSAAQYTWQRIKGTNAPNESAVYGIQGQAAAANTPGRRAEAATWVDASGNFWVFGGTALDETGSVFTDMNDLWRFDGANWTWVGGSQTANDAGERGALNTPAATNLPPARSAGRAVLTADGSVLLYGGRATSFWSDLWRWMP